ncbi:hypothetical protein PV05_07099 [Exophiala xenobiotica]|uniref:Uncharacterized protein n=1 Tax=Exophiala xenobiotica TaxID=348802 RepID=A0A0D2CX60_9EURO|nr:uncharacterized protein PV05_07099 [Exophiala xenobiotica]KIW54762.1 hypothetical protein PV05_07099 [Exophiala xenobiotica]
MVCSRCTMGSRKWQTPSILMANTESTLITMILTDTEAITTHMAKVTTTAMEVTTILTEAEKATIMMLMIPTVTADSTIPMAMEASTTCTAMEVTMIHTVTVVIMSLVSIVAKRKIGMKDARMTKENMEMKVMNMAMGMAMGTATATTTTRNMSERCCTGDT